METLLAALPALGCVVMMPAMMWLMSRGMRGNATPAPPSPDPTAVRQVEEVQQLRQEVERLRSELDSETRPQESAGA